MTELDHRHIHETATWAAAQLADTRVAHVRLDPGNATRYPFLIAAPGPTVGRSIVGDLRVSECKEYIVALVAGFGHAYPWSGDPVDVGYATNHWTDSGSSDHVRTETGRIVALFLGYLAAAIASPYLLATRVTVTAAPGHHGRSGTVTYNPDPLRRPDHLFVLLDGDTEPLPFHPTELAAFTPETP